MRFENKVAVITGAAQGIGLAVARRLFEEGASVVLADLNMDAAGRVAIGLDPGGERALALQYDAGNLADADAVVAQTVATFGRVDYLIPSAGIYDHQLFRSMTDAQWDTAILINLDGVAGLCRRVLPHMGSGGAMVLIASVAGHAGGSKGHVHYGATKGALLALGRGMARELGPDIRVNMVSPGLIETAMTGGVIAERGAAFKQSTPLGRYGSADEVAGVVAFLLSNDASFVTGEAIHVNGGNYMGG